MGCGGRRYRPLPRSWGVFSIRESGFRTRRAAAVPSELYWLPWTGEAEQRAARRPQKLRAEARRPAGGAGQQREQLSVSPGGRIRFRNADAADGRTPPGADSDRQGLDRAGRGMAGLFGERDGVAAVESEGAVDGGGAARGRPADVQQDGGGGSQASERARAGGFDAVHVRRAL